MRAEKENRILKNLPAFIPLFLLLAIPLAFRQTSPGWQSAGKDSDRLTIVTPHSEMIKSEFEAAFKKYYSSKFKRDIVFDWRNPGGTSDIIRYINDRYEAAFRQRWESQSGNPPWSAGIASAFTDAKLDRNPPADTPPESIRARKQFLESDIGIGIDIFFGGGAYDHTSNAKKGYSIDAGLERIHPDWFSDGVIPKEFSGETLYDSSGRFYGTCLSSFGICYNIDRIKENPELTPPQNWADLGEARFFAKIAVADPSKSGSINKCFEMLIQEQMDLAEREKLGDPVARGWNNGINLIKRIVANSRYLTDSAGKIPIDVASGDTVAGLCIDFYGRTQAEWTREESGVERLAYVAPRNGSSVSPDPIQILRGAPNFETARTFVEFVLSPDGQRLWNYRAGSPGGPIRYALRRPPIRKDMYTDADRKFMSDPDYNPYKASSDFKYRPERTAQYFNLIRVLVKCVAIDAHQELSRAWKAIIDAGGPDAVPEAMKKFNELPFQFSDASKASATISQSKGEKVLDAIRLRREWTDFARNACISAESLAKEGK